MTIYHNVFCKAEPLMTFPEIILLYEAVKLLPNDAKILELGSWKGGSTLTIGTASIGTERKITCIDLWDYPHKELYATWLENVSMGGIFHLLEPLQGDSVLMLKELAGTRPGYYDFCLLDTSHEYEPTIKEYSLVWGLVKSGGWIFMHDIGDDLENCLYPGCTRVWYERTQHDLINQKSVNALYGGQKP